MFQAMICNPNKSVKHYIFVCTEFNGLDYSKWLNTSTWLIDGTQTDTSTPGQSEHRNNCNKELLHILQSFKSEATSSGDL